MQTTQSMFCAGVQRSADASDGDPGTRLLGYVPQRVRLTVRVDSQGRLVTKVEFSR